MVEKYGAPGLDYEAQLTEIKESKPYIEFGPATTKGLLALDLPLFDKIIEVYRKVGMVKIRPEGGGPLRRELHRRGADVLMLAPATAVSRDIKVDQISMVFYGRGEPVIALDKIDMNIPAGQFASIIGPSGCGKSTLLRLVADVMQPFSGSITLGGETPRAARHAHSLGLRLPKSDAAAVAIGQAEHRTAARRRRARQRQALAPAPRPDLIALVGLTGFENALPSQLSGGMQQRVAIARALMLTPTCCCSTSRSARSTRSHGNA